MEEFFLCNTFLVDGHASHFSSDANKNLPPFDCVLENFGHLQLWGSFSKISLIAFRGLTSILLISLFFLYERAFFLQRGSHFHFLQRGQSSARMRSRKVLLQWKTLLSFTSSFFIEEGSNVGNLLMSASSKLSLALSSRKNFYEGEKCMFSYRLFDHVVHLLKYGFLQMVIIY